MASPEYRIPKHEVPAEIELKGHPCQSFKIFLSECAQTRAGTERPSDLLNRPEPFFPALQSPERIVFIQRDAVMKIRLSAEHEFGKNKFHIEDLAPGSAQSVPVVVLLENGEEIRGAINYLMPEGRTRLLDVLNMRERFLTLRAGDYAVLINKNRIMRVDLP